MKKSLILPVLIILLVWACGQSKKEPAQDDTAVLTSAPLSFVRYNADSPEGKNDLQAMAKALKKMRDPNVLPCENPLSWYYQGAIHWVPDTVKNNNPYCPGYLSIADTLKAWDNCTHIRNDQNSDFQFLIWHRLYIWHFEKIIRAQSGKEDFALPFWRYVDPAYRVMPGELRTATSALYTAERLDSLNNGEPISARFAASSLRLATAAAFQSKTYSVFNSQIDGAPHGAMHDYIGGGWSDTPMFNSIYQSDKDPNSGGDLYGWMTQVPSAGFDPVFWLHHSNIDFLWNEWENSANGERPPFSTVEKYPWHFVFPEPDGTFKTYTMAEAYTAAFNPNYTYAGSAPLIAMSTEKHNNLTKDAQLMVPQDSLLSKFSPKTKLGQGTTSLPLSGRAKESLVKAADRVKLQNSPDEKKNFIIKIEVSFEDEPTGNYVVFLDNDSDNGNGNGSFLGILSFFGAAHHSTAHGDHSGPITKTFLFDASDELIETGQSPHLIFKKSGGKQIDVIVENVELYQY